MAVSAGDYGQWQEDYSDWVQGGKVGAAPREENYRDADVIAGTGGSVTGAMPRHYTPPDPADLAEEARKAQMTAGARAILQDQLDAWGLGELIDWAMGELTMFGAENPNAIDAVLARLRITPTYQARFAGNEIRRRNGIAVLSEAGYFIEENAMRSAAARAGLPKGFYDQPDDFAQFIGNGVSSEEYAERVGFAAMAVQSVDPELRRQLGSMYGIGVGSDGDLIAYYLDPERAVSVFKQRLQLEAAGLSAASKNTLKQGFEVPIAERLAGMFVQAREIGDRLATQRGLVGTRLLRETKEYSASEVAAAEFGLDSDLTREIRNLRKRREEAAKKVSGALATTGGIVGLGSSNSGLSS